MLTLGLVAEGPHDIITLREILGAELSSLGIGQFQFRALQPTVDASGQYSDGGWTRVVGWAQEYSGEALETYFQPLFAGDPACDIIVVHLDGDAAPHVANVLQMPAPAEGDVAMCVEFVCSAIRQMLAPSAVREDQVAQAVPVLHTEAWVLAAEGVVEQCETIEAKRVLQSTYSHARNGPLANYYEKRATGAAKHIERMARNAESYQLFSEQFRAVALGRF
jgi:hypothetical protein